MTKVSVIIPMYNEEHYIGRCLESLKKQTFKDFEVILIDDGSKDNSIKIAESYKKDFNLTILKQKHEGPGKARNGGAKEAKGDILIFVDADMYFDKNYIKYLIQPILDGKEIGTSHGTELIGNIDSIWAKTWCIDRISNKMKRDPVYRGIKKIAFFESGGYNNDRFAFEDHIGEKTKILALVVDTAICYHNNPTDLKEVFNHEVWMGESLVAKGKINEYIKKNKGIFYIFLALLTIIIFTLIILKVDIKKVSLFIILILIILMLLLAIRKILVDRKLIRKYSDKLKKQGPSLLNYLWAYPILFIVKLTGYLYGICKFLIYKK